MGGVRRGTHDTHACPAGRRVQPSHGRPARCRPPFGNGGVRSDQAGEGHRHIMKVEWLNPHVWFYVDVKDEAVRSRLGILRRSSGRADAPRHHQGRSENRRHGQRRRLARPGRLEQRFGSQRDIPRRQERLHGNGGRDDEKPMDSSGRSCRRARASQRRRVRRRAGRSPHAGREAGLLRHLHAAFDGQCDRPARQPDLQRRQDGPGQARRRKPAV